MEKISVTFSDLTDMIGRVGASDTFNELAAIVCSVILILGIMNCTLGYRLLRFWMMTGGFLAGAGIGFLILYFMDIDQKYVYLGGMLLSGILLAVVSFLIYKAGVFLLAAAIGWTVSIWIIHPTSSASFFACVLIGIALGTLSVKFCRQVLIVSTSLIGGIMAGMSLAKIGNLKSFPYGIGMSAGFALLGTLIQFAINKPVAEEDEEEEEEDSDEEVPYETDEDTDRFSDET